MPDPVLGSMDLKMNETYSYLQKVHGLMKKKYA